jgi:hypothetical protein
MSRAKEMSKSQIANSSRDRDTTNGSGPDHVLVCGWCCTSTTTTSLRVMGTGRASAPPSVTEKVALHVCVIAPRCDSSSTFRTERTGEEPWPRQAIRSRAETPRPSEPGRKGL